MSAPNTSDDERVFDTLKKHAVPFVIVGGHAVLRHGYLRTTADVDVVWLRSPKSAAALLAALTELQAVWIGKDVDPSTGIERTHPVSAAFVESSHLMMLWSPFGPIDLFDYVPGVPDHDVLELVDSGVEWNGIRFASLPWLRRMKLASGRPKDLLDLAELARIHPET